MVLERIKASMNQELMSRVMKAEREKLRQRIISDG